MRTPNVTGPLVLISVLLFPAGATEHGSSIYPLGVDTVFSGFAPPPGQTMLMELNAFYRADALMNSSGRNVAPGFDLALECLAIRVDHNWGIPIFGGALVSVVAVPFEFQRVTTPAGTLRKAGFGSPGLGLVHIAYNRKAWHWWYGVDVDTPAFEYHREQALNTGQHHWAVAPVGAVTWLPDRGRVELSSHLQYLFNYTNPATHYRSGHEFIWEFAAMRSLTDKLALGVNGYYYLQTTDDLLNTTRVADGYRGRDLGVGPQVRINIRRFTMVAKYQRDTLVRNRPSGNLFWFQVAVPIGRAD